MRRLTVIDWDGFREVLADVVADIGTQQAAAEVFGVTQPHIFRLLTPSYTSATVSPVMLARIEKAVLAHKRWSGKEKVDAVERLWAAVMSREADRVFWNEYMVWLECAAWPYEDPLAARCERLFKQLAQDYPAVLGRLDRHWKRDIGHHRIMLAKHRIMEPLLASEATGGVELCVEELRKTGTLEPYLRCAVRKEEILLAREPDHVRAQKIAAQQKLAKMSRRS